MYAQIHDHIAMAFSMTVLLPEMCVNDEPVACQLTKVIATAAVLTFFLSLLYAVDSAQPLFGSLRSGVKLNTYDNY